MTIYFEDEAKISFDFDMEKQLEKLISFVCEHVKCPYEAEVSVTMVDKAAIQNVNATFREIDQPTDVLSFPMTEYDRPAAFEEPAFVNSCSFSPDTGELLLGDIVLCSEVVKEQAKEYGHSEIREFSFLVVHSMLHLFGYDHILEKDRMEMEEQQRRIMNMLEIYR